MPESNQNLDVNLDEFLPMPGSDDILTGPETSKTTVFSKPKDLDTTFLEAKEAVKKEEESKEDEKGELKPAELEAAKEVLTEIGRAHV